MTQIPLIAIQPGATDSSTGSAAGQPGSQVPSKEELTSLLKSGAGAVNNEMQEGPAEAGYDKADQFSALFLKFLEGADGSLQDQAPDKPEDSSQEAFWGKILQQKGQGDSEEDAGTSQNPLLAAVNQFFAFVEQQSGNIEGFEKVQELFRALAAYSGQALPKEDHLPIKEMAANHLKPLGNIPFIDEEGLTQTDGHESLAQELNSLLKSSALEAESAEETTSIEQPSAGTAKGNLAQDSTSKLADQKGNEKADVISKASGQQRAKDVTAGTRVNEMKDSSLSAEHEEDSNSPSASGKEDSTIARRAAAQPSGSETSAGPLEKRSGHHARLTRQGKMEQFKDPRVSDALQVKGVEDEQAHRTTKFEGPEIEKNQAQKPADSLDFKKIGEAALHNRADNRGTHQVQGSYDAGSLVGQTADSGQEQPGPNTFNSHLEQISHDAVVEQVSRGVLDSITMKRRRAVLHLNPPELGKVRVELIVHKNTHVHASFIADHTEAKHILETNIVQLKEQLEAQGFQLGGCTVDVGTHWSSQDGNGNFWNQGGQNTMAHESVSGNKVTESPGHLEGTQKVSGVHIIV